MQIHLVAVMTAGVMTASLALGGCAGLGVDFDARQGVRRLDRRDPRDLGAGRRAGADLDRRGLPGDALHHPGGGERRAIRHHVSKPGFLEQSAEVQWTTFGEGSEAQRQLYPNPVTVVLEPAPPVVKKKPTRKPPKRSAATQ